MEKIQHPVIVDAAELATLREDKARLDWLCSQAYFPGDAPTKGIYLAVGTDAVPEGKITLNEEQDRQTIRAAIDAVRK